MLAPHLTAFAQDAIDEAELARHKAEARKEAEGEVSARRALLDESEALLDTVIGADAQVSSLKQQLQAATLARKKAVGELEGTLDGAM